MITLFYTKCVWECQSRNRGKLEAIVPVQVTHHETMNTMQKSMEMSTRELFPLEYLSYHERDRQARDILSSLLCANAPMQFKHPENLYPGLGNGRWTAFIGSYIHNNPSLRNRNTHWIDRTYIRYE